MNRRLPTVKQLTYIVALDQSRHFGRAAEKCFISQSAFSVAIRELENLVGVQLVDRTNKSVALTAEGSLFAGRARVVVEEIEAMADAVKAVLKHLNIQDVLLVGHSMGGYVALAFAEKYSNITKGISLVNSTSKADSTEKKTNRDRAIVAVKHDYKTFIRIAISNLFNPEKKTNLKNKITFMKHLFYRTIFLLKKYVKSRNIYIK